MEARLYKLLEHVCELCGDKGFRILDNEDLNVLPPDELPAAVEELRQDGYLAVKYAQLGEYCLSVTEAGRSLVRKVRRLREERRRQEELRLEEERRKKEELRQEEERRNQEQQRLEEEQANKAAQENDGEQAEAPDTAVAVVATVDVPDKQFGRSIWPRLVGLMSAAATLGGIVGAGLLALVLWLCGCIG